MLGLLVFGLAHPARAAIVTVDYDATVLTVHPTYLPALGHLVGQHGTGRIRYDNERPDRRTPYLNATGYDYDAAHAEYRFSLPGAVLDLVAGSCGACSAGRIDDLSIDLSDDFDDLTPSSPCATDLMFRPFDRMRFFAEHMTQTLGGYPTRMVLYLGDPTRTALSNEEIANVPDPARYGFRFFAVSIDIGAGRSTFGLCLRVDAVTTTVVPTCSNGVLDAGEQCDDGNARDGDCCSATCTIEIPECPITPCHERSACDPATGGCGVQLPRPNGSRCDDRNACTDIDACRDGACIGGFTEAAAIVCAQDALLGDPCEVPLTAKLAARIERVGRRVRALLTKATRVAARGKAAKVSTLRARAAHLLNALLPKVASAPLSDTCKGQLTALLQERRRAVEAFPF